MSGLRIIRSSPSVSLQDGGRRGYLRLGVSEAGPMDWISHALANRLLGNPPDAAAIEFGPGNLEVEAEDTALAIAVTGRDIVVDVAGQRSHGPVILPLAAGERLSARIGRQGVWGYLAVAATIELSPKLGSLSTNVRTGLGSTAAGMALPGTTLPLRDAAAPPAAPVLFTQPIAFDDSPIGLLPGPQVDMFADDQLAALVDRRWQTGSRMDRMGYRLEGPPLRHARGADIVSDGIALGSVQVPGDGTPTVLMADRQPTGGYPKIATVIRADLPRLAQTPPGEPIGFAWTTHAQAVRHLAATLAAIDRPVPAVRDQLSSHFLLSHNLIDGAVAD